MRLFLTLCSLAAVAYAKPQYNYGTGISGTSNTGFSGGFGGSSHFGASTSGGSSLSAPSFGPSGFSSSSSRFQGGDFGSSGASRFGSTSHGAGFSSGGGFQHTGGFEAPIVHKQFFTIAAPEDSENLERTKHLVIGRPQKNYRVVFIKAPSSSNANVKLSAEYAPQEEKTAIYVLTKKDSSLEVNDIATPAPSVPSKPEVFFIKYKTEEEAQHAQRTIQAEYDKIEGTSEHTDGGVGQVQSVVGALDGGAGAGAAAGNGAGIGIGSGSGISSGSSVFGVSSGSSSNRFDGGISSGAKSPTYLPPGK